MSFAKELQLNLHVACLLSWGQRIGISRQLSFNQVSPIANLQSERSQSPLTSALAVLSRRGLSPTLQRRRRPGNRHMSLLIRKKNSLPFEEMPFSHCLTQCIQNKRDDKRHVNMCMVNNYIFILYIERDREWKRDRRDRCGKVRENAPFPALPKFVIKSQAEVRKNFSNAPNAYKRYGQPYAIHMHSETEGERERGEREREKAQNKSAAKVGKL